MSKTTSTSKVLGALDRDITMLEQEAQAIDARLTGLKSLREGIANVVLDGATRFKNGSRTGTLKEILQESAQPISVDAIMDELAKRGHAGQRNVVHSSLAYLRRQGFAKPAERGTWVAVTTKTRQTKKAA